jgi:hypothetical protein
VRFVCESTSKSSNMVSGSFGSRFPLSQVTAAGRHTKFPRHLATLNTVDFLTYRNLGNGKFCDI